MASGYEKRESGADPSKGWGKATLGDRLLMWAYLIAMAALVGGGLAAILWRMIG